MGLDRQTRRVNKMEIGQFKYMNNKDNGAKIIKNALKVIKKLIEGVALSVRTHDITKILAASVINNIKPARLDFDNALKCFFEGALNVFNKTPVVAKVHSIKNPPNNEATNNDASNWCFKSPAILKPVLINSQKNKFQNLSLLSHLGCWLCVGIWRLFCLVKSCMVATYISWFKTYYYIISKIPSLMKVIVKYLLIISMVFPKEVVLATDVATHDKSSLLQIIAEAEKKEQIPARLLESIAKIESGVQEYAINVNGKSFFAANKQEAISAINTALNSGVTNVDIGVMQLNWRWHKEAFDNIEEMLSAPANIAYAARLLKNLYKQHRDWHKAVRYYHSSNAEHYEKYSRKVVISWLNG